MKKADAYKTISEELKQIEHSARHEISDIWHGATNQKVDGGYGHFKKGYWTANKGEKLSQETFAHMFGATINNPEALMQIKKYFPESYKIFEEIVYETVKSFVDVRRGSL